MAVRCRIFLGLVSRKIVTANSAAITAPPAAHIHQGHFFFGSGRTVLISSISAWSASWASGVFTKKMSGGMVSSCGSDLSAAFFFLKVNFRGGIVISPSVSGSRRYWRDCRSWLSLDSWSGRGVISRIASSSLSLRMAGRSGKVTYHWSWIWAVRRSFMAWAMSREILSTMVWTVSGPAWDLFSMVNSPGVAVGESSLQPAIARASRMRAMAGKRL